MSDEIDEDQTLRMAALKNAQSVYIARQRAERELVEAKEALERKTVELSQQHEWFRVTLSSIGDAVITTDTGGNVTFLNPVAEKLTGWKSAEAAGRPLDTVLRIIHEQTRQPADNPVAEVLREGGILDLANHTVLIAKDGTETPIEDSAAPILNDEGKILGVILVFRDVGEKRKIEMRLNEAEWRSRTALEIGDAGSWVWDLEQDRVTGDGMLARVFGIAPETFQAGVNADSVLASIHEEDRERVKAIIRRAIETGEGYEAEFRVRDGTGGLHWMEAHGRVEAGMKGSPKRLPGILMDRTVAHRGWSSISEWRSPACGRLFPMRRCSN